VEPNPNLGTATPTTAFYQTGTVHIQSVDWLPNENALQLTVENQSEWSMAKRFLFDLDWSIATSYQYGDAAKPCLFEIFECEGRQNVLYIKNKEGQQAGIQQCLHLLLDSNLIKQDRYRALTTEINQPDSASLAINKPRF
jgi:hypothetical protein